MGQRIIGRVLGTVVLAAALAVGGSSGASASPYPSTSPHRSTSPVQQLTRGAEGHTPLSHERIRHRHPLALRSAEIGDEAPYLEVEPGCVKSGKKKKAAPHAAVWSSTTIRLDYVLTGPGRVHQKGTVKVKHDRLVALKLKKVPAGSYRLVLTEYGGSAVVGDQQFSVLPCVVVTTSCHAVTFTNPAGNPAASIAYGRSFDERFWIEIPGGKSTRVRIDSRTTRFTAWAIDDEQGVSADVGSGKLKVKQKCAHRPVSPSDLAVQTSANVGCGSNAGATVDLYWAAQPGLDRRRWEVVGPSGKVAAHGSYRSGRSTSIELEPGAYRYRSYANGLGGAFEDLAFRVLTCVTLTPACDTLSVSNPNDVDVALVVLAADEGESEEPSEPVELVARANGTTSASVSGDGVLVMSLPSQVNESPLFFSFGGPTPGSEDVLTLGEDC